MSGNKYLEKIASTRLIREIGKGAVNLTKDLKNKLVRTGAMRSGATYIKGMDEGADLLAYKHGVPIRHIGDDHEYATVVSSMGGVATIMHHTADGVLKPHVFIHSPSMNKLSPFEQKILHRHEIDEARGATKDISQGKPLKQVLIQNDASKSSGKYGIHNNLGILGRESTNLSKTPHLHPNSGNNRFLRKHRSESGEADTLHGITGNSYGKSFNTKNINKLNSHKGNISKEDVDLIKSKYPKEHHAEIDAQISDSKAVHIGDNYKKQIG
jgi:hypothetical protein